MSGDWPTLVELRTRDFCFVIGVCVAKAPVSSAYFLADVDAGKLDGSSIFRIVNLYNQAPDHSATIEVLQMGWPEMNVDIAPSIRHETTGMTGLRHVKGTVSLARFAAGAVYHSIFVCMRDEPELDEGGSRHPDGLGFAAFGCVVEGFERLARFFAEHTTAAEFLERPAMLRTVRRLPR